MSLYPEDHIAEITKVLIYCLVLPPRRRTRKNCFDPGAATLIAACKPETTENPDALLRINDHRRVTRSAGGLLAVTCCHVPAWRLSGRRESSRELILPPKDHKDIFRFCKTLQVSSKYHINYTQKYLSVQNVPSTKNAMGLASWLKLTTCPLRLCMHVWSSQPKAKPADTSSLLNCCSTSGLQSGTGTKIE